MMCGFRPLTSAVTPADVADADFTDTGDALLPFFHAMGSACLSLSLRHC